MKSLMRPGSASLSGRSRFTFERKKLQHQSSLCHIKNKVLCVFLVIFLVIVAILSTIYFDVATHSDDASHESHTNDIIIESDPISAAHASSDSQTGTQTSTNRTQSHSNTNDIYITSRTAYISTLDMNHANFLNLLHRRSLGFDVTDYDMMRSILTEYGQFAHETIQNDIANNRLDGEYIIITPAAQMCNRMRALMGSMLLGLLTQRVVFIDIGAEGYAARLNNIFISPGYEWQYASLPQQLKSLINGANHARWTFPYEWLPKRAVTGVISTQVCDKYCSGNPCKPGQNGKKVWKIDSHAGYLPLMARNEHLYNAVVDYHKDRKYRAEEVKYSFDYKLATHFMGAIGDKGQEYIESLEVLLGRMLFELEDNIQKEVDRLLRETYEKAMRYYTDQGVDVSVYNMVNNPVPVIGIHIRSEYVLLMNPSDCPQKKIANCKKPYEWFADCGIEAMDNSAVKHLNGVKPYLFIAADTKEAQQAAQKIFGAPRVSFRPFENTGSVFIGIQEAIIDLVSVSSFDAFVGTPHSSYSEMASILSQPRRIFNENENKFEFEWNMISMAQDTKHLVPVNRMIVPIMTNVGWEIDKLNLYTMGRAIDVNIDTHQVLIPQTDEQTDKYKQNRICKQTVTAGMGWMGLFDMFKNIKCYNPKWHHPSAKWFPIANK